MSGSEKAMLLLVTVGVFLNGAANLLTLGALRKHLRRHH